MGNNGPERLKALNSNYMNGYMNSWMKIKFSQHYTYILVEFSLIDFTVTSTLGWYRPQGLWKLNDPIYKKEKCHSYSLNKNILSNNCLQVIFLCIWNILVNKVNLWSFVMMMTMMMMITVIIKIANNFIKLHVSNNVLSILYTI